MDNYIGDNVNALRIDRGLSQDQLAALTGVSQGSISAWENGTAIPRRTSVKILIDALGDLDFDDILSKENGYATRVLRRLRDRDVEVPLFGSISAGQASEMLPTNDTMAIPRTIHERYPQAFLLKVEGESMNRILPNGTYALINPTAEVINGKIYAVCIGRDNATIKRVYRGRSSIRLEPDSFDPAHTVSVFSHSGGQTDTVTIIGRVVWYCPPPDFDL